MLRVQIPSPALAGLGRLSYDWQSRFSGRLGPPARIARTAGTAFAAVAQLVEHLLGKEEVMGSSPISSSRTNGARSATDPTPEDHAEVLAGHRGGDGDASPAQA